ncbi:hypothetical protein BFJ69_g7842 [Fusarium oxysporum]|uniref:Gentisate 1,2-dioxygenase n=1 Tax=Fusarium oxysporum TaxID=5507 RepID=A0A420N4L1_FUSOX|nr:hypothetical protein BFJ69_g7842 [Fusarium oxysporum]
MNETMTVSSEPVAAHDVHTQEQLVEALKSNNNVPLWAQMTRLNPPALNPRTVPYLWAYDTIRPYLLRAGHIVTEKQAERRVLMLANPARGKGGFTAIHGQRVPMHPRDVVVTPTWNWHDQGKKGADEDSSDDQLVIWLDGLDLPNFIHFPVHFIEYFAKAKYPADDVDVSPIVFSWDKMVAKLNTSSAEWVSEPYLRADGREIGRVIGASAEKLDAKAKSPSMLETASSVYHVIEGSGYSKIGDVTLSWKRGDTFCVPAWHRYQHFSDENKVYLYRFDDKPMLKALGFYRVGGVDVETLVSN